MIRKRTGFYQRFEETKNFDKKPHWEKCAKKTNKSKNNVEEKVRTKDLGN